MDRRFADGGKKIKEKKEATTNLIPGKRKNGLLTEILGGGGADGGGKSRVTNSLLEGGGRRSQKQRKKNNMRKKGEGKIFQPRVKKGKRVIPGENGKNQKKGKKVTNIAIIRGEKRGGGEGYSPITKKEESGRKEGKVKKIVTRCNLERKKKGGTLNKY